MSLGKPFLFACSPTTMYHEQDMPSTWSLQPLETTARQGEGMRGLRRLRKAQGTQGSKLFGSPSEPSFHSESPGPGALRSARAPKLSEPPAPELSTPSTAARKRKRPAAFEFLARETLSVWTS